MGFSFCLFVEIKTKGVTKMKRKTIKSLMSKKKVVYVRVHSEWAAQALFALAEYEGFTLNKELKQRKEVKHCLTVRLNEDMTLSYPNYHSWSGAIQFHNAKIENGKKVVKIDFETML